MSAMSLANEKISRLNAESHGMMAVNERCSQTTLSRTDRDLGSDWAAKPQCNQMRKTYHHHQINGWSMRIARWTSDNWVWEIGCWVLSTILFAGIVVILVMHDRQPLPDWPFGITINALISLLSTFSTYALLVIVTNIIGQSRWSLFAAERHRISDFEKYDEASRGPLGSLALLFSTKKWNGATLGASILIANMATGPFLQQIAATSFTNVIVGQSFLSARMDYPNLELRPISKMFDNRMSYYNIPDVVLASVYRAIYREASLNGSKLRNTLQTQPACSTGNCTYDVYHGLAICSACANITSFLTLATNMTENLTWTLPNHFAFSELAMQSVVTTTSAAHDPLLLKAGLPIVNITALQPCVTIDGSPCAATAQECMLYWCLNQYRSKVLNGIFYEDVIESIQYGYTINADLPENDTYVFGINSTNSRAFNTGDSSSLNFTVSKWASASLTDFAASLLTLNASTLGITNTDVYHGIEKLPVSFPGIPLDMSPFFEAMSISMTSAVRSEAIDSNGLRTIAGKVGKEIPYLRVQWAWISLPAILQVAVLILLCYMVKSTSCRELPLWKNSVLATLFVGARIRPSLPEEVYSNKLFDINAAMMDVTVERSQIFATEQNSRRPSLVNQRNQI